MRARSVLAMIFGMTLLLTSACGGGEKAASETTSSTVAAAAPTVNPDAASVTGTVMLNGPAPKMPIIQMGADPYCQKAHSQPVHSEEVVVGPNGGLANVFVYVKDYPGTVAPPPSPVVIDQKGCMYDPHVAGIQVGQTLQLENSDETLHNVHGTAEENKSFNVGQPMEGMVSEKRFDHPEVMVRFKCDVHPWMRAYVGVLPHPYFAVSSEQGSFNISNLPPGTYTIEAWHEKYGVQSQQVTVGARETKPLNFVFNAS